MTEYSEGDTFEAEDGQQVWQITDVRRTYEVTIRHRDGEGGWQDAETATFPEDVLGRKEDRGELEPVTDGQDDADEYECGAETTDGGECTRPVDGPDAHCHQHQPTDSE